MVAARWHAQALSTRPKEFWDYGASPGRRRLAACLHLPAVRTTVRMAHAARNTRRRKGTHRRRLRLD